MPLKLFWNIKSGRFYYNAAQVNSVGLSWCLWSNGHLVVTLLHAVQPPNPLPYRFRGGNRWDSGPLKKKKKNMRALGSSWLSCHWNVKWMNLKLAITGWILFRIPVPSLHPSILSFVAGSQTVTVLTVQVFNEWCTCPCQNTIAWGGGWPYFCPQHGGILKVKLALFFLLEMPCTGSTATSAMLHQPLPPLGLWRSRMGCYGYF